MNWTLWAISIYLSLIRLFWPSLEVICIQIAPQLPSVIMPSWWHPSAAMQEFSELNACFQQMLACTWKAYSQVQVTNSFILVHMRLQCRDCATFTKKDIEMFCVIYAENHVIVPECWIGTRIVCAFRNCCAFILNLSVSPLFVFLSVYLLFSKVSGLFGLVSTLPARL